MDSLTHSPKLHYVCELSVPHNTCSDYNWIFHSEYMILKTLPAYYIGFWIHLVYPFHFLYAFLFRNIFVVWWFVLALHWGLLLLIFTISVKRIRYVRFFVYIQTFCCVSITIYIYIREAWELFHCRKRRVSLPVLLLCNSYCQLAPSWSQKKPFSVQSTHVVYYYRVSIYMLCTSCKFVQIIICMKILYKL